MKVIIKDGFAGFVFKNGSFKEMIKAGSYHFSKFLGYEVKIVEMKQSNGLSDIIYDIYAKDETFASSVVRFNIPDGNAGFLYKNGNLVAFLDAGEKLLWNVYDKYEVKMVPMTEPEIGEDVSKKMLEFVPEKLYKEYDVVEGQVGLLYYNNILQKTLDKGNYCFWTYGQDVKVLVFDLRLRGLNVAGQEILTKDKIGIRLNVAASYKIADVIKFKENVADFGEQIYTAAQLVIREVVSTHTLDEILESREDISNEIASGLKAKEELLCIKFYEAGIKDIILPGDIKDIMNRVLVAEKTAQANVITRREEVASTRSLLNTAKLMDENQTLYKLKELEYLERICSKVGEISVGPGAGLIEQLTKLVGTGSKN